jgi:hypothetical protein
MATNHGVVYMAPGEVAVQPIEFPKLELDSTSSPVVSERQQRKVGRPGGYNSGTRRTGMRRLGTRRAGTR